MKESTLPQNLLTRVYDSVLNDNNITKFWNEYGSIATYNDEFHTFFNSIINEICSTQYSNFDLDIIFECLNTVSSLAKDIHSNSYNIQNDEIIFDEQLSHIKWLTQRSILNLTDRSTFTCAYDNIFWPVSIDSISSMIRFSDSNRTMVQMYHNIDCFFMELSLRNFVYSPLLCLCLNIFCFVVNIPEWTLKMT